MEIYLIRHTTPILSPGLIYGRAEVPLSDTFMRELEVIREKLPVCVDRVYSSPSQRCVQLASQLGDEVHIDVRLMEFDFGDWEGKTWDSVDQQVLQIWMDDFVHVSVPGGESLIRMQARVKDFWHEILQSPGEKLAVVTHAGVIRTILSERRAIPLDKMFSIGVAYGEVVVCTVTPD